MARDILAAKAAGATGVVAGVLLPNGDVDVDRMRVVRALSAPMCLTFHRAFDVCRDGAAALQAVVDLRCDRLLTSGRCRTALEGLGRLHGIVTVANAAAANAAATATSTSTASSSGGGVPLRRGLRVIAACGVDATNAGVILRTGKVHGVHAGSSVTAVVHVDDADKAGAVADFHRRECVSEDKVRQLVEACNAAAAAAAVDGEVPVPELAAAAPAPAPASAAAPVAPAVPPRALAPLPALSPVAVPPAAATAAVPPVLPPGEVRAGSPALDDTYVHVGGDSASPARPQAKSSILSSLFGGGRK
jgi:copper homeostasis protein CutC